MAEPTCKRPRDAEDNQNSVQLCEELDTKRPYDDVVLSILEDDVDVPSHNLSSSSSSSPKEEEEGEDEKEKERVMRLLLEASDDELELPSRGEGFGNVAVSCDQLWEIEDEDADYQTLVQSELFM